MFIKTLNNKRLLNTTQITDIYISEPKFEQKNYIIYASINLSGNFALAEAQTEAEAMQKKAEAYQQYTGAAVAEMLIQVLPDMAGKIAQPLSQIDKILIMDNGNGSGVNNVAGNVTGVMAQVFESMKEVTGVDLSDLIKAKGYDAQVTRNINVTGVEAPVVQIAKEKE